jgi:hypothetical protein
MTDSQKSARQRAGNARAPPVFRTGGAIEANMKNDTAQIYQQVHVLTSEQQQAQENMLLDIQRESDQTNRNPLTGKVMRYVLPALPVSGPNGKKARRREAARLAQRQGAARRSGKTRPAVTPPRLSAKLLCPRSAGSLANAAVLSNQKATERQQQVLYSSQGTTSRRRK